MEAKTEIVKTVLANGTAVYIQAALLGGEEEVAWSLPSFKAVTDAIEGISEAVVASLRKARPQKASIEFGLAVALESGHLTTLLVKGSGTTNFNVTLEWDQESFT